MLLTSFKAALGIICLCYLNIPLILMLFLKVPQTLSYFLQMFSPNSPSYPDTGNFRFIYIRP